MIIHRCELCILREVKRSKAVRVLRQGNVKLHQVCFFHLSKLVSIEVPKY